MTENDIYREARNARRRARRMVESLRSYRLERHISNTLEGRMMRKVENELKRASARSKRGSGYDINRQIQAINQYVRVYSNRQTVQRMTWNISPRVGSIAGGVAKTVNALTGREKRERARARQLARDYRRQNSLFRSEQNKAGLNMPSIFGKSGVGQGRLNLFYAATKQVWQNRPRAERENAILVALHANTLAEAYEKVMKENPEALRLIDQAWERIRNTDYGFDSDSLDAIGIEYWGDWVNPVTR